jgi:N-acetyl-gamma-glutamyl-phosphate reductase
MKDGSIEPRDIVIDGKSGLSGAGRTSVKLPYHFPEADEDAVPYAVGGHRHMPEMTQELSRLAGAEVTLAFTPHLVPMSRGMLVTIYASPAQGRGQADLRNSLCAAYRTEPFVHVLPEGTWPHTKWTTGTNNCFLAVTMDEAGGRAVIASAIDNIGRGQAAQMVQCLNIMLDVHESAGLALPAAYP